MDMLNNPEYSDVVSWTTDGKSFSINNSSDFVDAVLFTHFKVSSYDSFIRKVSLKFRSPIYPHPIFPDDFCCTLAVIMLYDSYTDGDSS